jgi:2'-5' RNA ligase
MNRRGRPWGGQPRAEDDPPGTSRLFIAVPVADDVRLAVGRLMEAAAGGPVEERVLGQPRWVRVEGLHLTLRFLGPTLDARQAEVAAAIGAACRGAGPFQVGLSGAGGFPTQQRPRVLWVGITDGTPELEELSGRLDVELQRLGWPPEGRPFQAHLTVARTDGVAGAGEVAARLVAAAQGVTLTWQADRVVLYRSHLGRGPARYEALAETRLG